MINEAFWTSNLVLDDNGRCCMGSGRLDEGGGRRGDRRRGRGVEAGLQRKTEERKKVGDAGMRMWGGGTVVGPGTG